MYGVEYVGVWIRDGVHLHDYLSKRHFGFCQCQSLSRSLNIEYLGNKKSPLDSV
jgi:hypothetical protein